MNLSPTLDSLSNLWMLFLKCFGDLMHLSEEFSPCKDNFFVFHPFKFREWKFLSIYPRNNNNWKVIFIMNKGIRGLFHCFGYERTNVFEIMRRKIINKENFVFNFLMAGILRIGWDSNCKFLFESLLSCTKSFKCWILWGLEKFSKIYVPEIFEDLSNLLMIELDFSLE